MDVESRIFVGVADDLHPADRRSSQSVANTHQAGVARPLGWLGIDDFTLSPKAMSPSLNTRTVWSIEAGQYGSSVSVRERPTVVD